MNNMLFIFVGGGLGSVARYGISEIVRMNFRSVFPWATLLSNILSCLILALLVGMYGKMEHQPVVRTFLVVGFCGGFSTFSTFSFETVELMRSGNMTMAVTNILISIAACIAIVYFISKQTV